MKNLALRMAPLENISMDNAILLFGGGSEERMVSVASAQNIVQQRPFSKILFLTKQGALHEVSKEELLRHQNAFTQEFTPTTPPVASSIENAIPQFKDAILFLGFHGTQGEDGTIQALLESHRIPFTGSGSQSSRAAFEKDQAKSIVAKVGVPTAAGMIISKSLKDAHKALREFLARHGKIVLKPLANGSSVGLHIVQDEKVLDTIAPEIISGKNGDYLAEAFLIGRELTVGVIQQLSGELHVLQPSEVIMQQGRSFDYEGKYLGHGTTEITPADLTDSERSVAQALALKAHQAIGCYGYSRTDIMLTANGPVFIETNTLPGLTKASFIPQQLAADGRSMTDFIENQLTLAAKRF